MANSDLRIFIFNSGLKMYEVADLLGIADTSLSRKLRKELSASEKLEIIDKVREGVSNAGIKGK